MIRLDGVGMTYRRVAVLNDLSLMVGAGEVYGLIGPNGAGKTTTLRILATLLKPTVGDARIGGHSVVKTPEKARPLIGYMPDERGPYEEMTVGGYLSFFAAAYCVPRDDRARVVGQILELADLVALSGALVEDLSRGQQQRLALARTLIHDPSVLLLDEPASGLDPRGRLEMRELLRELSSMGKTILISSHQLVELAELCSRVGILDRGRLLFEGTIAEALAGVDAERHLEIGVVGQIEEALALLEASAHVRTATRFGDRLLATLVPEAAVAAVSSELVEAGQKLIHLSLREVDLEDVYLSLTDKGDPHRLGGTDPACS